MSSVSLGPRVHRSPASPIVVCGQLLALSLLLGLALAIPLLYLHDLARDIFLTLALIFANVWAGSSLWVLTLRRPTRIAEALGVGVASAFIAPSLLLLATPLGLPTLFDWLILPAITIATVAWKSLRSVRTPRLSYSAPSWVGAGIAVLAGIALNRYWLELYRSANLSDPKSSTPTCSPWKRSFKPTPPMVWDRWE